LLHFRDGGFEGIAFECEVVFAEDDCAHIVTPQRTGFVVDGGGGVCEGFLSAGETGVGCAVGAVGMVRLAQ
jgi:hypothetical protein